MSKQATPQFLRADIRPGTRSAVLALAALTLVTCSTSEELTADQHKVYFVGYVYDGASGARLLPAQITAISVKFRDKVIRTQVEPDGRFVTLDPLPTWQDYAVYIGAPGYRPFVSRNRGIDVPASLSMTDKLGNTATTQTFHFDATVFPASLKSPAVVVTVEKADASVAPMPLPRATGTIRLRPESTSVLERPSGDGSIPAAAGGTRRWANDEDLLSQTITRAFSDGRVEIAEGELAYGVPYQIAIFDVKGYQPTVLSGAMSLLAGAVTSRSVTLAKELRDPLRILSTTAEACVPPTGTLNDFGAVIQVTFNEMVEFVGPTWAEDFDNGVQVSPSAATAGGTYCPLKTSVSPIMQERGTRVTLEGNVLTLAFNPSAGFASTSPYGACMVPPQITSVVYGNLQLISLQAKGDPTRKRTLDTMLAEVAGTTGSGIPGSLSCPGRARVGF
jgi:hypothetical protein